MRESPISTIYTNGNKSSHFNPILDSLKIYFVLFRFVLCSISAQAIDIVILSVGMKLFGLGVGESMLVSRFFSMLYYFHINKYLVFKENQNYSRQFFRFLVLLATLGCFSYFLTKGIAGYYQINITLSKVIAEAALFFASFFFQRYYVFRF